jgi:hypothetical protein
MAMTMKYSAFTSPCRQLDDKLRDAHDFARMVLNNPDFDREKLAELGRLLYTTGGKDLLEMARQVLAGEKLTI